MGAALLQLAVIRRKRDFRWRKMAFGVGATGEVVTLIIQHLHHHLLQPSDGVEQCADWYRDHAGHDR